MIALSRDQGKFLSSLLEQTQNLEVTYEELGVTRSETLPPGYRHDHLTVPVGRGDLAWRRAQDAIRGWRAHLHAGLRITPADAPIAEGGTVVASRSVGPLLLVAPCRIIYTTKTSTRFGFAYGTLPGHPEQGEEAFHVQLDRHGDVTAEIVAFSRPADLTTRLAGPVARQIQKVATKRYIEGISGYVRKGPAS